MEPMQNLLERLPYKQEGCQPTGNASTDCGVQASAPNTSRFSGLERPAEAGLTQRSECHPYKVEVGGSNPSARTIPYTTSELLDHLSRVSRAYNALYAAGLATPETVKTLSPEESAHILSVATEVSHGEGDSELHRRFRAIPPHVLNYVVGGGI